MTISSSSTVMVPLPSTSKMQNASLNSVRQYSRELRDYNYHGKRYTKILDDRLVSSRYYWSRGAQGFLRRRGLPIIPSFSTVCSHHSLRARREEATGNECGWTIGE